MMTTQQAVGNGKRYWRVILLLWCWLGAGHALAETTAAVTALAHFQREGDFSLIKHQVMEPRPFFGLAAYYNSVAFYTLTQDGLISLEPEQSVHLQPGERFIAVGRFNVLVIRAPGRDITVGEETFSIAGPTTLQIKASLVAKDRLTELDPALDQLRYHHLWLPFALLTRAVEWVLVHLQSLSGLGWGMTIVAFTVLLKVLMVPLGIVAARMQDVASQHQAQLAPVLAEIKAKYDGEEAHRRIMAAHEAQGVSTFFALKPLLVTFVQVPVWIAVFNALGEMPQLFGSSFLWIENLSYPDRIATMPFSLPLLGISISLLPLLMTLVTIASALLFQDRHAPPAELTRQKRNLYLMAIAFLVLFYPFPAAMVLYWTLSNALHIVQQRMIRV